MTNWYNKMEDELYDMDTTNAIAIRRLFGDGNPDDIFTIKNITTATLQHHFTSPQFLSETLENIQAMMSEKGTTHPLDGRYAQVPAKLLMNANGDLIILTKYGYEIIFLAPTADGSSRVVFNEYRKGN